ncbi:MAG: peroxiredoxin [Niameybacter sp.]|uniref:peroxiredoxin n=1 Tax=Niameybacter sp. TaxID=2033640 RepID=UPI002FCC1011
METIQLIEGMQAPNFSLAGSDGQAHQLSDYLGKKVILYFYPKDNTPGCSKEAEAFRDQYEHFSSENTVILGISRDTLTAHAKFIDKYSLPFVLLSDKEEVVCKLYDVLKEKTMCGRTGIGIERSTFIIDETGKLVKIYRKVKVAGHVDAVKCTLSESL